MIDRIPRRFIEQTQRELHVQEEHVRQKLAKNKEDVDARVALAYLSGKKRMLECFSGDSKKLPERPEKVISDLMSQARFSEGDLQSRVVAVIQNNKTTQIEYWTESARQYVAGLTFLATENWARLLGAYKMQGHLGVNKDRYSLAIGDSSRELCKQVQTTVIKILGEVVNLAR